jgi:hypothetical protein
MKVANRVAAVALPGAAVVAMGLAGGTAAMASTSSHAPVAHTAPSAHTRWGPGPNMGWGWYGPGWHQGWNGVCSGPGWGFTWFGGWNACGLP